MKKFINIIIFFTVFLNFSPAHAGIFQGIVAKDGLKEGNQVIDAQTNAPISRAKIVLPQKRYKTYTDSNGNFNLNTDITGKTIMSVEKPGYKPFSVTLDENSASKPIIMGIEKTTAKDLRLESGMIHLGDNNYSATSANSGDFQVKANGPFFTKDFKLNSTSDRQYLVIGSIIGIDTAMAKRMGQNHVTNAYASPPEVYFNGNKIAEIQLNGDGQKIHIPSNLIRPNQTNEVTIKTGRNLMQTAYTDYDDIEFMNLSVESD
jgi:hypothetical protein